MTEQRVVGGEGKQPVAGSPGDAEERRPVVISDPQAVRALAHEARLEALEELYSSQSTRTATELASRCGLTPSAMSYHLRALEKYGFVERSPSEGDGRERRWKAAGISLLVDSLNNSPVSKHAFIDMQLNTFRDRIMKEVSRREAEDQSALTAGGGAVETAGRRPPVITTGMVFVDAEQRAEFISRLYGLIAEFEELNPAEQRSVDAERVYYMLSVLPDSAHLDAGHAARSGHGPGRAAHARQDGHGRNQPTTAAELSTD